MTRANIIGAGFSGIAASCVLADKGVEVNVFEKNESPGGRARKFESKGFIYDMGPSWYWMPDVFEQFFNRFDKSASDYYELIRLDPSYRVYFGVNDFLDIPAGMSEIMELFESLEKGSAKKLHTFLREAEYKYRVGMKEFVWKPGYSIFEFIDWRVIKSAFRLNMFSSVSKEIRSLFQHPKIIQLLEFPVLFLGATPQNTPALYSLMNYADLQLGTWYPKGGMYKIVDAMVSVAEEKGVTFHYNEPVTSIETLKGKVSEIITTKGRYEGDYVIASSDYHHSEQQLLQEKDRMYSEKYWKERVMAPSSLLFYIGLDREIDGLQHHNLFFDKDFAIHANDIYTNPKWPDEPLFYVCCPSKTDKTVSPMGKENVFILIPIAPGLKDNDEIRDRYFNLVASRLHAMTGVDIRKHVLYKRSYCVRDFEKDYHAFRGNAYGLANTLMQTAFLKPKIRNNKIKNLYFTGQLTTPGPGVPPSLISGQLVAQEIIKRL